MTQNERDRLVMMVRVKNKELSLRKAAAVLGLSYRQSKRIWRRYRRHGDAGLVHRLRGQPSPRRKSPKLRAQVLARYRKKYPDFGPTLAAEHLSQEGLKVDHETLRRWLLAQGWWSLTRARQKHRQWRERKECFGEMVQMDGSEHDWFEGRRARAVLMVMIDDATNRTYARFFEGETTEAAFLTLARYAKGPGLPQSLYVDRDSIYRTDREPTLAEQLAGQTPQTQFGRAMERLGVKIILAYSPQAKGRVERRNGVFQDRLVKEMRLKRIGALEPGNEFLEKEFLPELNRKFAVAAKSVTDLHRPAPKNLSEILACEQTRQVAQDWTIRVEGIWLQIDLRHESLNLAGKQILVRDRADGKRELVYGGEKLRWRPLPERPIKAAPVEGANGVRPIIPPKLDHPWRRFGTGTGRPYWRKQKRVGAARKHFAVDSVAPPLRSGSTASTAKC